MVQVRLVQGLGLRQQGVWGEDEGGGQGRGGGRGGGGVVGGGGICFVVLRRRGVHGGRRTCVGGMGDEFELQTLGLYIRNDILLFLHPLLSTSQSLLFLSPSSFSAHLPGDLRHQQLDGRVAARPDAGEVQRDAL